MENMPQNIRPKDLSFVVQAIGADIERTQVRLITSANADMLLVQQVVALIQNSEKTERYIYTTSCCTNGGISTANYTRK